MSFALAILLVYGIIFTFTCGFIAGMICGAGCVYREWRKAEEYENKVSQDSGEQGS